MNLDFDKFWNACNPSESLKLGNAEDLRYYIDFSEVRGGKIINVFKRTITRSLSDKRTCQLFSGHIGCGKSTELSRLEKELTDEGFHVVYFESTQDLDEMDLDLTDIMLAIARRVTQSLEEGKISLQPQRFKEFLKNSWNFLQTPVTLEAEGELFGSKVKGNTDGNLEVSLPLGIAKITAQAKINPGLRSKLRQYMEPQANKMLELINQEIIDVAINQLKQGGKKGLVVIVDNLDRIVSRPNAAGRLLPEYIFIDRGDQLRQLNCHLVYTVPLGLIFGNESEILKNRLGGGVDPKVLPMVPVKNRDGSECVEGMNLLRRMVMSRAFPDMPPEKYITLIAEVFDSPETLDELCRVSGGHLRNLMGMLFGCLQQDDPPISQNVLKSVIRSSRDTLKNGIDNDQWELLFKVVKEQSINGDKEYQDLLRNLWVFEYVDLQGNWFALNPLLMETDKFKLWQQQNY
ncbi:MULTISPECIES: P-loop NTPase fold protein [unclassified Microcoleus]|uniref:P-loop NTPase fold protein n=1 Tax=unclassified Microcoleus TaxID=2642155 RepID=UPI002FD44DFF